MRRMLVSALLLISCLFLPARSVLAESSTKERSARESHTKHHFKVRITSPAKHVTINSGTIVRGYLEAPDEAEVGVTVNGRAAEVNGKHFAFSGLMSQPNGGDDDDDDSERDAEEGGPYPYRIRVSAVSNEGDKARDKVSVVAADPFLVPAGFSSFPTTGQAPLDVRFALDDIALSTGTLFELDYEGDGVIDMASPTLDGISIGPAHTYGVEGLYSPTLTITDRAGAKTARTIIVNVRTPPDLKKKWDDMTAALQAGNVARAATCFATSVRESYSLVFSAMADAGVLAQAAGGMGDIEIVGIEGDSAEGDLRVEKNGKAYSHPVFFVRDTDGIWRIRSF